MANQVNEIWKKHGSTGIFSLVSSSGNYMSDPDFVDPVWLKERFSEPGLKGIIIRGSGRHFSAGADLDNLNELVKDESLLVRKMTTGKALIQLIERTSLPVIAEIKGVCFGGGLEIALACHARICSDNALFAFPEASHGIMPGLGGTINLSKLIGQGKSAELILTGEIINAEKALEMNLVDYTVSVSTLHDYTLNYLAKLTADREVDVIRSVMKSINNAIHMDYYQAMKEETRLFCDLAVRNLDKEERNNS